MKKLYFLLLCFISLSVFSQKDYSRYYNSWRLGLNLGGAWQTADYRSCWGIAGGITLEKGFHENSTNFFSFAVRGRYLGANTYGMDYNRNYDVKSNDAYNGKYDPKVNYVDSVSVSRQYVYDNYKMQLSEGSLELQVSFNRLREQTHVLLNLWGGIGFTSYRTKSDLLTGDNKLYDFSLVDSTGNQTKALNTYNGLIDKKYESYAYGSKNGNLVTFSPSLGVGLGYQFSPGFSMLWEYKITFPQGTNADLLDGKLAANNDFFGSNDYYHYTGLNLVFTLRGKKKTPTPKDETTYTNTVVPTNTVAVPTTSIAPPTNTVVTNTPPTQIPVTDPKPIVTFVNPTTSGQVVYAAQYKISAQILNITNVNQIQFKFNGVNHYNFNYNAQTHLLEYNATLNNGNNSIQIIATNNAGQDNRTSVIIYDHQRPAVPPVVSYINPVQAGAISAIQAYQIKAQVLNVNGQNEISVYYNGMSAPFSYDATTKQVTIPLTLNVGSNAVSITANNAGGEDTKTTSIVYKEKKPAGIPPVVTYINPVQPGVVSLIPTYEIKAQVLNIAGQNEVSVYYNGLSTPFTYNATTKQVAIPVVLNVGSNSISITANNSGGEDTKVSHVVFKEKKIMPTGPAPVVNLINPATQINATDNLLYNFKLSVLNVTAKANVELLFNGVAQTNFTYDPNTKEVFFQTNLIVGNNTVLVKGTNSFGSDSKQINVNYTPHAEIKMPPVVTISNPLNATAVVANPNYTFKASVTNVINASGLTVKFNGNVITNYVYDGLNLTYNAQLAQGNNSFEVNGHNNDGSDTKTAVVNYKIKVAPVLPVVNYISPGSGNNSTIDVLYSFKLAVLNVNSKTDIEVLFNGVAQTNFTYDPNTKEMFFQTNLISGNNTLSVKGTNQFGSDVKLVNVTYSPIISIKVPPLVTFVNPVGAQENTQNINYVYTAKVDSIGSINDLSVKFNGNSVTNFTFDGTHIGYAATLNLGTNTLEISATNADGSDTKTATVNFKQKIIIPHPPIVTILQPVNTPTVNAEAYNFIFKALNVSQSQIQITLNGAPVTQFNFGNNIGTFTADLGKGISTVVVTATNTDGTDTKTETIVLMATATGTTGTTSPGSSGTETTTSTGTSTTSTQGGQKTVVICHKVAGANPQTITIPIAALTAHLGHGDTNGACPTAADSIKIIPRSIKNIPVKNNSTEEKPDTTIKQQTITPRRPR
ncbi:MAG: hypothetical protein V4677_15840 [Bacteroidota bacterium]